MVRPLNYVPYVKEEARRVMADLYGWEAYPQKHFESRFTRFYEGYWLPTRFGYDTRRVQFSSLILTNQMTREDALKELEKPAIPVDQVPHEIEFVATKLGITPEELITYRDMPIKSYQDYKSQEKLFEIGGKFIHLICKERDRKRTRMNSS